MKFRAAVEMDFDIAKDELLRNIPLEQLGRLTSDDKLGLIMALLMKDEELLALVNKFIEEVGLETSVPLSIPVLKSIKFMKKIELLK